MEELRAARSGGAPPPPPPVGYSDGPAVPDLRARGRFGGGQNMTGGRGGAAWRRAAAGPAALLLPLARPLAAGAIALGPRCASDPPPPGRCERSAVPAARARARSLAVGADGAAPGGTGGLRGRRGQAWVDAAQSGFGGGSGGGLGDAVYPVLGVGAACIGAYILREETSTWGEGEGAGAPPPPPPADAVEEGEEAAPED